MKRLVAILFVAFMFGVVSLLAAQDTQTAAPANVAPAVATSTTPANSGATAEPSAASNVPPRTTAEADKSPAESRTDSPNKPVPDREGNPDPAQNVIEYGGPG